MDQGAVIVQQKCAGVAEQIWILTNSGNGSFHLMNALSGLCLDARGKAANGTPVQQWTCNGITNENWEPVVVAGAKNKVILKARVSGSSNYCLDVPGGKSTPGLAIQIYSCNNTTSQIWQDGPSQATVVPNVMGKQAIVAASQIYVFGLTPNLSKATSGKCTSSNASTVLTELPQPGTMQSPKTGVMLMICPPL